MLYKIASRIGHEDAVKLLREIVSRGRATEDELASATGIRLNEIRKILFKLHNFSLAFYESVQDKKTGWLIYYWRVQPEQFESVIRSQKRKVLEKLEMRLEYEKGHDFFHCFEERCRRRTFEEAAENIFKCPNCGKPLQHFDNSKIIEDLAGLIDSLKRELERE